MLMAGLDGIRRKIDLGKALTEDIVSLPEERLRAIPAPTRSVGEVRQMGFLLFYLTPAFYCDVSDCYLLTSRKGRLWVTFAGVYLELILCSLATFVWYFAVPGTLIYDLSFKILLFTGISSFLINMNPLIRLDGYYAVMDSLEVPDLREESFQYLGQKIRRLFGLKVVELEGLTRRKRKIFVIYGSLAILYTAVLYLIIVLWLKNIFLKSFHGLRYLFLLAAVHVLFRSELRGAFRFVRFVYLDKREVLMKRRTLVVAAASLGVLLLATLLYPTHIKISSRCVVEPVEQAEARPEVDGFVREILVRQNQTVVAGQELARMGNPELAQEAARAETGLKMLDRRLMILQSAGDVLEYRMKLREKTELTEKKNELDRKLTELVLRSPIRGRIATPYLEEKRGKVPAARGRILQGGGRGPGEDRGSLPRILYGRHSEGSASPVATGILSHADL